MNKILLAILASLIAGLALPFISSIFLSTKIMSQECNRSSHSVSCWGNVTVWFRGWPLAYFAEPRNNGWYFKNADKRPVFGTHVDTANFFVDWAVYASTIVCLLVTITGMRRAIA